MKIAEYLIPADIITSLIATSKEKVLDELATKVVERHAGFDKQQLLQTLLERESLGSTGIGDGIAIPHAKLKSANRIMVVFGRSSVGVDFDALDCKPVHLFFLLVAPENCAGLPLRALAKIARLLKNVSVRKRLGNVQRREDIYSVIQQEDEDF